MTKWKKTEPSDPFFQVLDSATEAAWRTAMQPVDRRVSDVEKKWGCLERLIEQVDPELASRFGSAWHKLNAAILDCRQDDGFEEALENVVDRAAVVMRGLDALEQAAGNNWSADVWGITVDGGTYLICQRAKDVRVVSAEAGAGVSVWSLEELIRVANSAQAGAYAQVAKGLFPDAVVKDIRPATDWKSAKTYNDELPF